MINITIQIYNGTQWETLNTAVYPVTINERLDAELDGGNFVFYTKSQSIYPPFTKCKITVGDTVRYFYMSDAAVWQGGEFWKHTATLTEPTKILEGYFVSGLAVTQPRVPSASNPAQTLYDVLQRVLDVTPLRVSGESPIFQITTDSDIVALLQGVDSPEFRWGSQTTLWEVLSDIGLYIDAMPRLTASTLNDTQYNTITFDLINDVKEIIEAVDYTQASRAINESQYCSALETDAENIVASNAAEASTVFPGQGAWATVRSEEVQLTSDNGSIILPTRIERLSRVVVNGDDVQIRVRNVSTAEVSNQPVSAFGLTEMDITDFVIEQTEWQTLDTISATENTPYAIAMGTYKNNTWTYVLNSNVIQMPNTYSIWGSTTTARNVLMSAATRRLSNGNIQPGEPPHYAFEYNGVTYEIYDGVTDSAINVRFRVEYNELNTSSKTRAVKSDSQHVDFVQPFNQRAEINNAQAFGRNMKGTVDRMGVPVVEYFERVMSPDNVKKVGSAIEQNGELFIITTVEQEIYAEVIYCTYGLSQNWSLISQYVRIDKKFRNWNIPAEILQRNLYDFDYALIGSNPIANTARLASAAYQYFEDIFTCAQPSGYTNINNAWFLYPFRSGDVGAVTSAASFAVGPSLLFSGKTQDNLSAGKNRTQRASDYVCRDIYYCEEDGTMLNLHMIMGAEILPASLDTDSYPQSRLDSVGTLNYADTGSAVLNATYIVKKDPAEQLNFAYQVHFVSSMDNIVIGPQMALTSPLVRQISGSKTFQVWGLTKRVPQHAVKVLSSWGTMLGEISSDSENTFFSCVTESGNIKLTINAISGNYTGWAITDENGNLYLAQNKSPNTATTLYMGFVHSY